MNDSGHIFEGNELVSHSGRRRPSEIVAEYEDKLSGIPNAMAEFKEAITAVAMASRVAGQATHNKFDTGYLSESDMKRELLESAWRHLYETYNLEYLASAKDKKRIEQMFARPPEFTIDNIREQFGEYVADPRGSILRGLAEVFCDLDPAFKSHEKMKIGVSGLPKRVILPNVDGYGSYGRDRLLSILNAIASVQGKPLLGYVEATALVENGEALRYDGEIPTGNPNKTKEVIGRGVWLKKYGNGNGHLYFDPETLRDVNKGLAEYYGEVLPDCPEERPAKQRPGTDVSKDLQYYPTPNDVIQSIIRNMWSVKGKKVLEPSCGDGRIMDALRAEGADVIGCEVDLGRAEMAEAKGHYVMKMNFLETEPVQEFDAIVMNPPFYGRHYVKHVRHAMKFLKPGGELIAILPVTARYEHKELDYLTPRWSDLPVGSFSESGTNINTTVGIFRPCFN